MKELIEKIEKWADERNIIKGSKPLDQAMKLFSEFGELADNVGKGKDCRDDIGDIFVVLTIMAKQLDLDITISSEHTKSIDGDRKYDVTVLGAHLIHFSQLGSQGRLDSAITCLQIVCNNASLKLEECVQIAYDDIKDRRGILWNGVFVKESDPSYMEISKMFN